VPMSDRHKHCQFCGEAVSEDAPQGNLGQKEVWCGDCLAAGKMPGVSAGAVRPMTVTAETFERARGVESATPRDGETRDYLIGRGDLEILEGIAKSLGTHPGSNRLDELAKVLQGVLGCTYGRPEIAAIFHLRKTLELCKTQIQAELDRGYVLTHEPRAGEAWRARWNEVLGRVEEALIR